MPTVTQVFTCVASLTTTSIARQVSMYLFENVFNSHIKKDLEETKKILISKNMF